MARTYKWVQLVELQFGSPETLGWRLRGVDGEGALRGAVGGTVTQCTLDGSLCEVG